MLIVVARTKQTAWLVDGAAAPVDPEVESFDFGSTLVTKERPGQWLVRRDARLPKGETDPKPRDDEVVVFREFFFVGLRLVLEILKRFGFKFHQITLSCFMKLSVLV
jgi:hypothetical protein